MAFIETSSPSVLTLVVGFGAFGSFRLPFGPRLKKPFFSSSLNVFAVEKSWGRFVPSPGFRAPVEEPERRGMACIWILESYPISLSLSLLLRGWKPRWEKLVGDLRGDRGARGDLGERNDIGSKRNDAIQIYEQVEAA